MTLQICDIEKSEELSKEEMAKTAGGNYNHPHGKALGYQSFKSVEGDVFTFKGKTTIEGSVLGDLTQTFNGGVNIGNGVGNTNGDITLNS
jgi:hypothetical protein